MKIYKVLRVAAAASLLSGFIASGGCTRDEVLPIDEATAPAQSGCVSIEHALEALSRFNDGEALTRTAEVPAVAHVDVLMRSDVEPATRTADAGEDAPLCYIAQFEGGGYAILGANDKQAPVVAYVPKGSLTAQELADAKAAADRGEDYETPTYINACVVEYLQDAAEGLVGNEAETITRSGGPIEWPFKPLPSPDDPVQLMNTTWHQDSPYNKFCFTSDGKQAKVGCIALTLGQIMAYNKKTFNIGPSKIQPLDGTATAADIYYPAWESITKAIETATPNLSYIYEIGRYLSKIGRALKMDYGIKISNASVLDAAQFLREQAGYKNVSCRRATLQDIKNQIRNFGTPVFASGPAQIDNPALDIYKGGNHAWVIDGWKLKTHRVPIGDGFIGDYPKDFDYLYCRFGYPNATYDGWYQYDTLIALEAHAYRIVEIIYYTL